MEFYSFTCKPVSGWKIILFSFNLQLYREILILQCIFKLLSYSSFSLRFRILPTSRPKRLPEMVSCFVPKLYQSSSIILSELSRVKKWVMVVSCGSATSEDISVPEENTNFPWHLWAKEDSEILWNSSSHQSFTENTSWEVRKYLLCRTSVFSIVIYSSWDFLLNLWSGISNYFFQKFGHSCSLYSDFSYLADSVY